MTGAEKLIKDIEKKLDAWDEKSQFQLKGIGNLSFDDMEILKLYAKEFIKNGSINNLITPMGNIEKILKKYNIQSQ